MSVAPAETAASMASLVPSMSRMMARTRLLTFQPLLTTAR